MTKQTKKTQAHKSHAHKSHAHKSHTKTSNQNQIQLYTNSCCTRLVMMPSRKETEAASLYFYFKVGSKNEPPEINGISHFIEHMIYKGSPKFKKYSDITPVFDINGISFNAYTTKDVTAYHYKFLSTKDNVDLICKISAY
jgi:predicted Zn-dependent peptidase